MTSSPDEVCRNYAKKNVKFSLKSLAEDGVILIEGDAQALEFLGQLLLAQAHAEDCAFHIRPDGAGKAFFSNSSTLGICIHRVHDKKSGS